MKKNISQASCAKYLTFKTEIMDVKLEEVQEWFAQKSNKKVIELDMYDMFCAKVAYDYACERLLDVVWRSEQFNCFGGNYAKGIKPCEEWCGEDMCQKPSN